MGQATRAGLSVHWSTFGTGPRPALFLHCSLAHSGAWARMATHLSDRLSITAPDLPSHGKTERWTPGMGDYHDVSTAVAETFLDGPMDLVGHSFGATVALRLAVMHPARVRSLTLIEPVFFAAARRHAPEIAAAYDATIAPFDAAWQAGDRTRAAQVFTDLWGGAGGWAALPDAMKDAFARQIDIVAASGPALFDDHAGLLSPGVLDRVTMPTLLVEGSESLPIIAAVNDALLKELPAARRAIVTGAGHMAPISHPAPVAQAVAEHLDRAGTVA